MGLFQDILLEAEQARQWDIIRSLPSPRPASVERFDGFMVPDDAAQVMGISLERLELLARQGVLEWRVFDGDVLVRPAVIA